MTGNACKKLKARMIKKRGTENNTDKTGLSKTTKENSINTLEGVTRKHTNYRMPKKPNDFGRKYGNQNNIRKILNRYKNITRELAGLEVGPKREIHIDLLKTTLKRISNWKTTDHDGIHGFCFKKFTAD